MTELKDQIFEDYLPYIYFDYKKPTMEKITNHIKFVKKLLSKNNKNTSQIQYTGLYTLTLLYGLIGLQDINRLQEIIDLASETIENLKDMFKFESMLELSVIDDINFGIAFCLYIIVRFKYELKQSNKKDYQLLDCSEIYFNLDKKKNYRFIKDCKKMNDIILGKSNEEPPKFDDIVDFYFGEKIYPIFFSHEWKKIEI